jgi:hypothetical protein
LDQLNSHKKKDVTKILKAYNNNVKVLNSLGEKEQKSCDITKINETTNSNNSSSNENSNINFDNIVENIGNQSLNEVVDPPHTRNLDSEFEFTIEGLDKYKNNNLNSENMELDLVEQNKQDTDTNNVFDSKIEDTDEHKKYNKESDDDIDRIKNYLDKKFSISQESFCLTKKSMYKLAKNDIVQIKGFKENFYYGTFKRDYLIFKGYRYNGKSFDLLFVDDSSKEIVMSEKAFKNVFNQFSDPNTPDMGYVISVKDENSEDILNDIYDYHADALKEMNSYDKNKLTANTIRNVMFGTAGLGTVITCVVTWFNGIKNTFMAAKTVVRAAVWNPVRALLYGEEAAAIAPRGAAAMSKLIGISAIVGVTITVISLIISFSFMVWAENENDKLKAAKDLYMQSNAPKTVTKGYKL